MNTNLIASRAVIARFQTGAWRTVKRHKDETKAENARHGLTNEARVDVQICTHPALEGISDLVCEARLEHYRLTLPAADEGMRLLPGSRQLEHSQVMQTYGVRHSNLVAQFLADYDNVRVSAPARLKGLYVAEQWPDHDVVASKFKFRCTYLPVPDMGQWGEWLAESAELAQAELRSRLGDAIRKLAAKLADPKAIFRDTLVSNLSDVLSLVPDLNIADDPELATLATRAKALTMVEPDTLREDMVARATVAERAQELCDIFKLS